jgi:ABC-type nickel/cobalt efflux system permease component RcnA
VFAHPFGSNLYGHKTEVWLARDQIEVAYLAEIPTPVLLRELKTFLADVEQPVQADQDRHTDMMLAELKDGLRLLIDGERVAWQSLEAKETSGVGDTRFISYHLRLKAPLPSNARAVNLVNGNRPDDRALFATEVYVGSGVVLDASSQIDVGEDGQIQANRSGAWRRDEKERELRLSFRLRTSMGTAFDSGFRKVMGVDQGGYSDASAVLSTAEPDVLPSLVKGQLTPRTVLFALVMALILGAAHAFSPGHGKALVAAYLLGERRSLRHAFLLGAIVTATHTVSVFILGGLALALSEVFAPESILPWMELVSGILVFTVGIQLMRMRMRAGARHSAHHDHHHHDHHHHDHHHHDPHDEHQSTDDDAHSAIHARQFANARTPKDLWALGVSGGLVPCPSALVLLLTAISFHRIAFGLVLVAVFSLGLALVVTAVGVTVVLLGERLRTRVDSRLFKVVLPVFSAIIVTVLGAALSLGGARSVWMLFSV